jgi:hypothetical protein
MGIALTKWQCLWHGSQRNGKVTGYRRSLNSRKTGAIDAAKVVLGEQMIVAARRGDIMEVERLIMRGADMNFCDKHVSLKMARYVRRHFKLYFLTG